MPRWPAHPVRPLILCLTVLAIAAPTPALAQPRKKPTRTAPAASRPAEPRKKLITRAPDHTETPNDNAEAAPAAPQATGPILPRSAPKPWRAPFGPKEGTPLWADTVQRYTAFESFVRASAYDHLAPKDPKIDEKAKALLARSAAGAADPTLPPLPPETARELVAAGSADPLIRSIFASSLAQTAPPAAALPVLQDAADAMRASRYCSYLKAEAIADLATVTAAAGQRDRALTLFRESADFYLAALTVQGEPVMPPAHAYLRLAPRFAEDFPPDVLRSLCDRLQQQQADPWLVNMLWGKFCDRVAWDARGRGATSSQQGLKTFTDSMTRARDFFEAAYTLKPGDPAAAAEMLSIVRLGLARPGQDLKYWFDLAIEAQFDYPGTYTSTLAALRPRWGGDYAAMLGFGLSCSQSERYDTLVPYQLIQAALDICEDLGDYQRPWTFPKVYELSKQVLTRYIQTSPSTAPHHRALLAGIAWRAGKYEDAQFLLDAIGPSGDLSALRALRITPRDMIEDVAAHTGPAAEIYLQADQAAAKGDLLTVRTLCEQAAELCKSGPPAMQAAAAGKLASARVAENLLSGDWVDLTLDDPTLWTAIRGRWTAPRPGIIRAEQVPGGPLLILRPELGQRYEIQGQIGFGSLTTMGQTNAGIGMCYDPFAPGQPRWHGILLFPGAGKAAIGSNWPAEPQYTTVPSTGAWAFDAVLFDGNLRLTVNNQVVFAGPLPKDAAWQPGRGLVLGAFPTGFTGAVEYTDLRIRKLRQMPSTQASGDDPHGSTDR